MSIRRTRSAPPVAGLAALALIGLTACGGSQGTPSSGAGDNRIVVVASTDVWASVVEAVGGDAVTVRAILSDATADPHGYEAKPADATAFDGARLAVSNGGGYDDFFTGLADTAGKDARRVVAVEVAETEEHAAGTTESAAAEPEGHDHDHANEHVWYDFEAVHAVARKVAEELGAVDPARAGTFTANAAAFGARLEDLTTKAEAIGKARPGAKVVATEAVAAHLLETAGLVDATPAEFAEAVEEETDPPAAALAETEAMVTGKQVAALIRNPQTETPVTKGLEDKAKAAGLPVVAMAETLPDGATGYLDWMNKQVDALAGALAGA